MIIPHVRQNKTYDFSEFQDEISEFEKSVSKADPIPEKVNSEEKNPGLFLFDPNTATYEELLNLDLEPKVAGNILKYRDKGGIFRTREDLKKIYGFDSASYVRLEPFIRISFQDDTEKQIRHDHAVTFHPLPLNNSDSAALVTINGIGPVLSARIIKYRNLLGGYVNKEQLLEVYGMSEENFAKILDAVYIDTADITPININTADFTELTRHPYLNDYQSRAILTYREINGRFNNTAEIEKNNLLPGDIYLKLKPYLIVE
jgi:DNA uptake protein ComE-like DNA-binding protein